MFLLVLIAFGVLVMRERFMDWIGGRKRSWDEIIRQVIRDAIKRGTPKDRD